MTTMTLDRLDASRVVLRPVHSSSVRLTRRGRLVVFVLTLAALAVLGLVGASMAGASGRNDTLHTRTITVAPGVTLWSLASKAAHGGDVLAMEREIEQINGLTGGMLIAGQSLRIPS